MVRCINFAYFENIVGIGLDGDRGKEKTRRDVTANDVRAKVIKLEHADWAMLRRAENVFS